MLDAPRDLASLHLFLGEVENRLVRSGFVQQLDGAPDRVAELLVAEIALLAEADQQHAIGKRAADTVQQQRRAELPFHVAAPDDFADVAVRRAIDQFGRQGQLAIVENADDDTCAALLLGATAFYGKFHPIPRVRSPGFLCDTTITRALSSKRAKKVKIFPPS